MNVLSFNTGDLTKIKELENNFGDSSEFITNFKMPESPTTIELDFGLYSAGFFRVKNNNEVPQHLSDFINTNDFKDIILEIAKELSQNNNRVLNEKQIKKRLSNINFSNLQLNSEFVRGLLFLDGSSREFFSSLNPSAKDEFEHLLKLLLQNQITNLQKDEFDQFIFGFSRIFPSQKDRLKIKYRKFLNSDGSNLELILKKVLLNDYKRFEFKEWLDLFIAEFRDIEISKDLKGKNELKFYEKFSDISISNKLISDGTFNILCLLTAVYQSDEPQFLCIEEPENGLNPYVIRKLVDFFRNACAEKGHYIWLNTHSQTLVECLEPEEVIVVDKINGETQVKQIKGMNLHGLDMAEVWLSGALGGGTPW
jgi:hypothetical protein